MGTEINRRKFFKDTMVASAGTAVALGALSGQGSAAPANPPAGAVAPTEHPAQGEDRRLGDQPHPAGRESSDAVHAQSRSEIRLQSGRPLQHRRKDPRYAGGCRGQRDRYAHDPRPAALPRGPQALSQGTRRKDQVDHLLDGASRAGAGQIHPGRAGIDRLGGRSDLSLGRAVRCAGQRQEDRSDRQGGRHGQGPGRPLGRRLP